MFKKIKKYFEERKHKRFEKMRKAVEEREKFMANCKCAGLPQMGHYEGEVTRCWVCGKNWVWRDGCSVGYWREK